MLLSLEAYVKTIVGVALVIAAAIVLKGHQEVADGIYRYYQAFEDPKWRPRWLPMFYRPTMFQARLLTWLLVASSIAFGLSGIITGVT